MQNGLFFWISLTGIFFLVGACDPVKEPPAPLEIELQWPKAISQSPENKAEYLSQIQVIRVLLMISEAPPHLWYIPPQLEGKVELPGLEDLIE